MVKIRIKLYLVLMSQKPSSVEKYLKQNTVQTMLRNEYCGNFAQIIRFINKILNRLTENGVIKIHHQIKS